MSEANAILATTWPFLRVQTTIHMHTKSLPYSHTIAQIRDNVAHCHTKLSEWECHIASVNTKIKSVDILCQQLFLSYEHKQQY